MLLEWKDKQASRGRENVWESERDIERERKNGEERNVNTGSEGVHFQVFCQLDTLLVSSTNEGKFCRSKIFTRIYFVSVKWQSLIIQK